MCDFDPQFLAAYHDDELGPADRARVENHVRTCPACAAQLTALRDTSQLFVVRGADDELTPDELARVHTAVDVAAAETIDAPILRLGTAIGVVAASILVVSCAWLTDLPKRATNGNGGGGGGGATQV